MATQSNFLTKVMSMDEATWERHANPWSVWTRVIFSLPVILLSLWSIRSLGYWSIGSVAAAVLWTWLNPRLFPPPRTTDNWASKVTFGERVWLNRAIIPIEKHHAQWAIFLSVVAGGGFIIAGIGAVQQLLLPTIAGGITSWLGKMWFCDRMVWLYEGMKDKSPDYLSWLKK